MGINFKVDKEKCVHCGLCIKDCMSEIITFDENKIPVTIEEREKNCIKCQHCLSVCPVGAISVLDKNPEESTEFKHEFNSDEILELIKERRSIRYYKKQNVEPEQLQKLKDMLKYVPTGVNNHQLHFTFVENLDMMEQIRTKVKATLLDLVDNNKIAARMFRRYLVPIKKGKDVIFRGAPHMVIVSTHEKAPCKDIDPIIALSYFELYAKSLGIGTCWCGLAYYCFSMIPHLKNIIKVPKTHKIAYVMLFGYPEFNYKRSTQPEAYGMDTVDELSEDETFGDKIKNFFSKD
ncbi:nitroreductase family protein [bacterium]|nr:nitroreductase family protein [bacterium]